MLGQDDTPPHGRLRKPKSHGCSRVKFTERNIRASGKRGIVIYAKDDIASVEVKFQTEYEDHVWIKLKLRNNDALLCGCIYSSPSKPLKETSNEISQIINEAIQMKNSHLLICGEFLSRNRLGMRLH